MIRKAGIGLFFMFISVFFGCNGGQVVGDATQVSRANASSLEKRDQQISGIACKNGDPNHLCLALKYVVYKDSSGQALMNQSDVKEDIDGINEVWNQCNIEFQVEKFVSASPKEYGLKFHTADDSELDEIRKHFEDESTLLVVTTGAWNRDGSLGNTYANAWTSMPGEQIYGTILESPVKSFSNIIAHELGHYLSLGHVNDSSDLMNPVIYDDSDTLSTDQCNAARDAIATYWQKMIRRVNSG